MLKLTYKWIERNSIWTCTDCCA